jgi:hypothetical protein
MEADPQLNLHASRAARYVFAYLRSRGGSMRLGPLQRGLVMDARAFIDAVNELSERYWITIVWQKAKVGTSDDEESRPLAEIYRICTTRFGRQKYRTTWPVD